MLRTIAETESREGLKLNVVESGGRSLVRLTTQVESVLITRIDVAQQISYFPGLEQYKQKVKENEKKC